MRPMRRRQQRRQRNRPRSDMADWLTLYTGGTGQIEEKKSRFIATIEPVSSEEEAAAFIASVKKYFLWIDTNTQNRIQFAA